MKKLALLLAVVMVCMMAACGGTAPAAPSGSTSAPASSGSTATPAPAPTTAGNELAVCVGPDPETIDPAMNSAVDGATMIAHAFEGLMTYQPDGSYGYGSAESHTVSDDLLTYTFKLRDGLKWSDGSPLTANDFVYSWKRVCDPETAAPYGEIMKYIAGYEEAVNKGNVEALQVKAIDDKTLEVTLAAPCAFFLELCAFPTYSPVQQSTIETNGDAWAISPATYISNGPFMITDWVPGEYIMMSRNPNYWDDSTTKLDKIKFVLMEDANAVYNAYQSGAILCAKDIPSNEIAGLKGNPEYHLDTQLGTYYLNLQNQKAPFDNVKVRQALSLAVDRKYMAEQVMQGTYVAAGNFVGPGFYDADTTKQFYEYATYIDVDKHEENLAKAKTLLAEAGFPEGKGLPVLEYSTNDAGFHKPVAEALQQMWGELGIKMEIQVVEWSAFTPIRRAGDFQMARNGWVGDYNDPSTLLDLTISTNGNNDGKYNNPKYDELMKAAASTGDQTVRMAKMHEAEKLLMDEAGVIPVAYYAEFYLMSEKLEGAWHSPLGYFFFMDASIKG